jgi:hypothetical protein
MTPFGLEPQRTEGPIRSVWLERARHIERVVVANWSAIDGRLFVIYATLATAFIATTFIGAMLEQTGGEWSAPLDDVFIHFDFARSTARGYPFQWSEGNGFSSGNTSITYPFALAFGYWIGFRKQLLMAWAVLIACLSVLAFFGAAARIVAPAGPWAKYLVPPAILSVGALDWSLMSGMENAFHLGIWAASAYSLERLVAARDDGRFLRPSIILGAANALLVLTRPESAVTVAALSIAAAVFHRKLGVLRASRTLVIGGLPAVTALGLQSVANRVFTGEWAQAGAITKVALYHPYFTSEDKWNDWTFHFKYVIFRMTEHHFSDAIPYGYIVPAMALVPFAVKGLRWRAALLWIQVLGWFALVALNGQVRWQNERYAMSGVAWLLLLAAMGIAALLKGFGETLPARIGWGARLAVVGLAVSLYWHHQRPNFRDQVWFFARASRNIRDQHILAGRFLRELKPKRVLVGDAGAIVYASDLPALDIIGLGGYKDYPFARATKYGLGGAIELIERMPDADRPDVLAIYPSWWGDLPLFGSYLTESPVFGNVICGGASKVIYKADWSPLDRTGLPRTIAEGEKVVGAVDVGDLMSEREARYVHPRPAGGYLTWRVLASPTDERRDLFDAGRIIAGGKSEEMDIAFPQQGGRLLLRTVTSRATSVRVLVDGHPLGDVTIAEHPTWQEPSLELPTGLPARGRLRLESTGGEWTNFHVWTVE